MRACNKCKKEIAQGDNFFLCYALVMGAKREYYNKKDYVDVCEECFNIESEEKMILPTKLSFNERK